MATQAKASSSRRIGQKIARIYTVDRERNPIVEYDNAVWILARSGVAAAPMGLSSFDAMLNPMLTKRGAASAPFRRTDLLGGRVAELTTSGWLDRPEEATVELSMEEEGTINLQKFFDSLRKPPESLSVKTHELHETEQRKLRARILFLETRLRSQRGYSHLFKLGAGGLLLAVLSLLVWAFTGIGAPLHPIFAVVTIPAAIGMIAMAFLVRRETKDEA